MSVINTNSQPISYSFVVIAAYCSNFGHFAFWRFPLGLKTIFKQRDTHGRTYQKSIAKPISYLNLLLMSLYSTGSWRWVIYHDLWPTW